MRAAFPDWALSPFQACSTRLRDIDRVLRASTIGLSAVTILRPLIPRLLPPRDRQKFAEIEARIRQSVESLGQASETVTVDLRQDHLLLNASAVVSLWSALEVAIEDFLIAWLTNERSALSVPVLRKIKISLAEYDALDSEERMRVLLNELERSVIGKQGVDCFEPLLDTFGLSGPVTKPIKDAIYELQHVRNVVVHRGGRADRRSVEACPDWGAKAGHPLKIKRKHYWNYQCAVGEYVLTVAERVAARLGVTASRELDRFRSSLRKAVTQ